MSDPEKSTVDLQPPRSENIVAAHPDNPNLKITTFLFNGNNYLAWSHSVTLFLKGRGKWGTLTIESKHRAPSTEDATCDKWEMENSIVMTWLCHSMTPEIGEGFLDIATA